MEDQMPDFMGMWLQEKAVEVHRVAQEKGWWERPRENAELIELVHSEITEATEEVRNGRPLIYQFFPNSIRGENQGTRTPGGKDWNPLLKPEGVLIEYADVGIRILDILEQRQVKFAPEWDRALAASVVESYPNELCFHMVLRKRVSQGLLVSGLYPPPLVETLALLVKYFRLKRFGVDFRDVIETKMTFNRTRPERHGNKRF
jgi:hypothetical protein